MPQLPRSQLPTLLQLHPELQGRLPHLPLGAWPTPVERLPALGERIGRELWIKRDDLSAPAYGGNKVRKLEHLLGEARARRCRSVVTVGGAGSSHMIATGYYGRQLGLQVRAVVVPQPTSERVRANVALAGALGVELVPCPTRLLAPLYLARAAAGAARPSYLVGPGGSSPLGTVGYVSAALELGEQLAAGALPPPAAIYVALGSGGTLAGLALGCAMAGIEARVVGVRTVERPFCNATLVRVLIRRCAALLRGLGLRLGAVAPRFRVVHDQFGGRYGRATPAAERALRVARETEGLQLETTYTAKTLAALLGGSDDGERAPGGGPLLFWNTFNSRDTSTLARVLHPS